jgi:ABC-type antimicrobial peptide transport system permease subunit
MAYAMQQRTPEFGLRLALGARASDIVGLALGQAMRLGIAGTVIGLSVSLIVARLLGNALYLVERQHEGLLYGVTTTDPSTLALACVALTALAAIAGFVPAARAMRIDPAITL